MKPQEYLELVLKQESLSDDSDEIKAIRLERKKVEQLLQESFKESNPTIQYAGSYKKGTMIKNSYDLDIICYFNRDDNKAGESLEEIFNNVKKSLDSKYRVISKTSALRLENSDPQALGVYFHIDVIPGRYTDENKRDAFLYQSDGDKKYLKTNLQKHIDHIKDSGLIDTIKLAKFWKIQNGLEVKTFVLELLVIEVLEKVKDSKKLDENLQFFFKQLKDNIDDIKVEDPANLTGNDLSNLLSENVRSTLSSVAAKTLELIQQHGWESIFGTIESMSRGEKIAAISVISRERPNSPRPWGDIL